MQAHGRVGATDDGAHPARHRGDATHGRDGRDQRSGSKQAKVALSGRKMVPSGGESRWCDGGPRHPDAWSRRHDGSTRPLGPNVPGMQVHGRGGATNDGGHPSGERPVPG
jgi:hypothetical protein